MTMHHQRGAMLLEALTAALVIGISFVALLQTELSTVSDIRAVTSGHQAVVMASNIVDRMRNNPVSALNAEYRTAGPVTGTPCVTACTAAQVAQADLIRWYEEINQSEAEGTLPEANARIDAGAGLNQYVIVIEWSEFHSNNVAALLAAQSGSPAIQRTFSLPVTI